MFSHKRRKLAVTLVLVVFAAAVATAAWPARRFIGVNYVVTEHTVPLWVKAIDFVDRDINLERTAEAIVRGIAGDERRSLAVLHWTYSNIRPHPAGFPIVDDHVWHVIVRGYGQSDQHADVFTTLLTYAGVPAYWQVVGRKPYELPLSYALVDGTWRVVDVFHRIEFRNASGAWASPHDLAGDAALVRTAAAGRVAAMDDYLRSFDRYQPPAPPDVLRADLQMTGRRLAFELRKAIGRPGRVWQMRAAAQ